MKRLLRHLFTLCSAASLVVLLATCLHWVGHPTLSARFEVGLPGSVRPLTAAEMSLPGNAFGLRESGFAGLTVWRSTSFLHDDHHGRNGNGIDAASVTVPYWLVAALTATPPACWLAWIRKRHVRLQRSASGQCEDCGYDLRASPDRCPECGAGTPSLKAEV